MPVGLSTQSGLALMGIAVALIITLLIRADRRSHAPRIGQRPDAFGGRAKRRAEFLIHGKRFVEDGYTKV